jgi:ribonuclease HII
VVCAAIFRCGADTRVPAIAGLRDSKKLSEKRRFELDERIRGCPALVELAFGESTVADVNEIGGHKAKLLAFERAVAAVKGAPDIFLVDGSDTKITNLPRERQLVLADADAIYWQVSAASILAKCHRDRHMMALHAEWPDYDWITNKGYGTPDHSARIARHGPSPHHRKQYIRRIKMNQTTG